MASKADFTEDEWNAMQKGVMGAGFLVSASDPNFMDTFPEMGVLSMYLDDRHEASESELVRELAGVRVSGFGLIDSEKEAEAETLEALRASNTLLATKAPDEVGPYRELVLGAAAAV